ncbi:unnamed protein product [Cochlearia groenlandica]
MNPPLLKLVIVQGPREGDSLVYNPGSIVRIGRFVRGNEIAIKDAGISTKHLRIVSDSENWIINDLGSSNGTILNSDAIDPDTPVILRHGDVIKLGEYTSIVVEFLVADVTAQENKLPPRPKRNINKRVPVSDPNPDLDPVQEKPTRNPRSVKQDAHGLPKRARAKKSKAVEEIADNETKLAITKEEEEVVPVEKKANSKAQKGKDTYIVKLEVENTPKGVEISDMKRATRSNKKEIGGDSFQELEMVLKRARKNRKKPEQKPFSKSVVVETEVVEETEKLQDTSKGKEAEEEEATVAQGSNKKKNVDKVDLSKMTLGEWFDYMEVYLRKQIMEETEEMIEGIRSKARRVREYIAEHKQAQAKGEGV